MSTNFKLNTQWIFLLIVASHMRSSTELKDCPLIAQNDQYCIRNHNGIVPTVLDKDMWITFNRSVAKTCLSVYDFKPGILPIRQIRIRDLSGPILAVYSQSTNFRVGVENREMQNNNRNNRVSDAFMLIHSTLCSDCCFIMAVNFTQFTLSDNVNETWNGMLYSSDNDLYVSSAENKPATISKMVWRMGSESDDNCRDSSPLKIQGTITRETSTKEKGAYVEKNSYFSSNPGRCAYCSHALMNREMGKGLYIVCNNLNSKWLLWPFSVPIKGHRYCHNLFQLFGISVKARLGQPETRI